MTNERLRAAFQRAGLSPDMVASQLGVDPKTVQNWLGGRTPHRGLRWAVSQLVEESEQYLWPDPTRVADDHGANEEVLQAFPRRASVGAGRWRDLIGHAARQIDILGYSVSFLPELIPEFVDLLRIKCQAGCWVRLVLADPDCEQVRLRDEEEQEPIPIGARIETSLRSFRPLCNQENAEIRLQRAPMYNSMYRFDNEMFVTPHLFATPGRSAPLFHLRRLGPNGVFARFASHFELLWSQCTPVGQDQPKSSHLLN
jgi:hypothetical protein